MQFGKHLNGYRMWTEKIFLSRGGGVVVILPVIHGSRNFHPRIYDCGLGLS